jgi:hypothetical protein
MLIFFSSFGLQMKNNTSIKHYIRHKLVTAIFITASLVTFAALGDGKKDDSKRTHNKSLLSAKTNPYNFKNFSLRSRYNYRGSTILNPSQQNKYITLNTVATYQKGNITYILPLKKKVLLDKITFNPVH